MSTIINRSGMEMLLDMDCVNLNYLIEIKDSNELFIIEGNTQTGIIRNVMNNKKVCVEDLMEIIDDKKVELKYVYNVDGWNTKTIKDYYVDICYGIVDVEKLDDENYSIIEYDPLGQTTQFNVYIKDNILYNEYNDDIISFNIHCAC